MHSLLFVSKSSSWFCLISGFADNNQPTACWINKQIKFEKSGNELATG